MRVECRRMGRHSCTVLNTHLRHATRIEPDVAQCAQIVRRCSGAVLLGGDFNPLPIVLLEAQFADLLEVEGVAAAGELGRYKTWDLAQPLSRATVVTPRSSQLDFFFVRGDFRRCVCRLHRPAIFTRQPLSHHFGLVCEIEANSTDLSVEGAQEE